MTNPSNMQILMRFLYDKPGCRVQILQSIDMVAKEGESYIPSGCYHATYYDNRLREVSYIHVYGSNKEETLGELIAEIKMYGLWDEEPVMTPDRAPSPHPVLFLSPPPPSQPLPVSPSSPPRPRLGRRYVDE